MAQAAKINKEYLPVITELYRTHSVPAIQVELKVQYGLDVSINNIRSFAERNEIKHSEVFKRQTEIVAISRKIITLKKRVAKSKEAYEELLKTTSQELTYLNQQQQKLRSYIEKEEN